MCGFVWVSGSLVDHKGKILVPGMYKDVAKLTDEETKLYDKIEFDLEEYTKDTGAQRLLHNTKVCFSVSVLYVLWTNYCTLFAGLLFSCTIVKQLSICSNATNLHQVQLYANENCIVFWEWSHFSFSSPLFLVPHIHSYSAPETIRDTNPDPICYELVSILHSFKILGRNCKKKNCFFRIILTLVDSDALHCCILYTSTSHHNCIF